VPVNQPTNSRQTSDSFPGSGAAIGGKESFQISAPSISLPKGGGAIRGMGEKFAANRVTGTGSMTVPIATSPGRSGFGPQLSLSYDSGAGNGPFGFGWSLSLPAITRKTDKGLPRYRDAEESDIFILSGAEDLVPTLINDAQDNWVREPVPERTVNNQIYRIQRYRPRIEGLFARIERWTNKNIPEDVFWRSISKDNITTWYGRTENSRVFNPSDPTHIFSWLICQSYDDRGNVIVYQYKAENSENVDLSRVHERNRTHDPQKGKATRTANRYLKRIYYGNREPYLPKLEPGKPWPEPPTPGAQGGKPNWFFEVVFDYDDGHYSEDKPDGEGRVFAQPVYLHQDAKWLARVDPFSTYRAGFEVRTYRLCQRVLMFHHFPEELGTPDYLVRSTDFSYSYEDNPTDARNPIYSFLDSVSQSGYVRRSNGSYLKKSLPPLEFEYTKPEVQAEVREVDPRSLENLPFGLDGSNYLWVDLDGEGLSGILTEQAAGWFYKRNLSPVNLVRDNGSEHAEANFGALEIVAKKPSLAAISAGGQQFLELAGDGQLDLVALSGPTPGFFERTEDEDWEPFKPFSSLPNIEWNVPNLKFVDLTGDGHADVLITEDDVFWWYPSLAEDGFGPAQRVPQNWDEEKGPRLVLADAEHSIHLADFSGDGLTDLVRIRNGEVCYWPNLGYGRFGPKVTMDNSPWFDSPDQFDPRRIQLADIDGSGTTDIIYLGTRGIDLYFNQSGNGWSQPQPVKAYPQIDNLSSITAMDLLGTGTACLVWSSPLPGNACRPMRYIDLMAGQKPHLLVKTVNNLGAETTVRYAPSTKFYVADKLAGKPWITKVPFPVHVVEKTTVTDKWRKTEFSTTYSYHHGYYDGVEREFRGFGRVEQVDVEDYGAFKIRNKNNPYLTDDDKLYQPPVKTITWFHTGAFLGREIILSHFASEYFPAWYEALDPTKKNLLGKFHENQLPEPDLNVQGFSTDEWREALRACKGMTLRQEIYELDVEALEHDDQHRSIKLFSTAYHNCHIQRLQPKERNQHAVFLVTESEAITYHYELALPVSGSDLTPDPHISHMLNLIFDDYGRALQTVAIAYPRQVAYSDPTNMLRSEQLKQIQDVQRERHLAYTETHFTDELPYDPDKHRVPAPCEMLTYELTGSDATHGFTPSSGVYFSLDDLRAFKLSDSLPEQGSKPVAKLEYHEQPLDETVHKRIVEWVRMLYFKDDLSGPNPFSQYAWLGLPYETYKVALTRNLLDAVFGAKLTADVITILNTSIRSGYIPGTVLDAALNNQYWMRSGVAGFATDAKDHFYLPERYTDPFSNTTELEYDVRDLFIQRSTDAMGNITAIADDDQGKPRFDYRVLAPLEMVDMNGNHSEAYFDILGMVVASAIKGKKVGGHWQGDNLDDFATAFAIEHANPPAAAVVSFCTSSSANRVQARTWLGNASARFVYHFGERIDANGRPAWNDRMAAACGIVREQHVGHLPAGEVSSLQIALECSDGGGNVLMKKSQAEPDPATSHEQWIVNGLTVLNNKGKPVKQYEPVFSDRFGCEMPQANGVTPIMYYDAPGRLIRTELPDGSFSRVEFSPWFIRTFDQNDTVMESQWYRERLTTIERGPGATQGTSDEEQKATQASPEDKRAARLAAHHANTPEETHFDSLGREVIAVAHNRTPDANGVWQDEKEKYLTFTKLDAEGKPLWIRDARGNLVMQYITLAKANNEPSNAMPANAVPCYDIAGNLLFQHSMDAGGRWMLMDASGKSMAAWDLNDKGPGSAVQARLFHTEYDKLHRPTKQWLGIGTSTAALVEAFEYSDTDQPNGAANLDDAKMHNLIGQPVKHWDPSGLATVERIDLSGKPEHVTRSLIRPDSDGGTGVLNWDVANRNTLLESEIFHQITEYDALGRMTRLYNWHRNITFGANGSAQATPGATNRVAVYEPSYNERGALISESLHVRATKTTSQDGRVSFTGDTQRRQQAIKGITYNEKAQKLSLELGNGTTTRYTYDPNTFRLTHLYTRRNGAAFTNDCSSNTADDFRPQRPCGMQNLHYTYDPVGNITHIQDDAQDTIWFANAEVDASSDYIYDAIYRLIEARGRENSAAQAPPPHPEGDWPLGQFPSPNQVNRYTQSYQYDTVGNVLEMKHKAHRGPGQGNGDWTRQYTPADESNRLRRTWYGTADWDDTAPDQRTDYRYDTHGSMLNLARTAPGLDVRWDWRDVIRALDLQGGGQAFYNYGIDKQRTRKYLEREITNSDSIKRSVKHWDRIYLGGYELYRRYNGDGTTLVEEIESHHVFEGEQRMLLVDDVLKTGRRHSNGAPYKTEPIFRYQYSNHLGSACLELDHEAEIISYEEYHPYGTSAYRAMRSKIEAPLKRYRYTGMERDEESELSYHSARYYVPWLGRWASADPRGLQDGINALAYCRNAPVNYRDPNGHQTVADYFKFIRDSGGFSAADAPKGGPPRFNTGHASPFGTAAHSAQESFLNELKGMPRDAQLPGIQRVYGEVAIEHNTNRVIKIGGSPVRGAHNLDLAAAPTNNPTLSLNQTVSPGHFEAVADSKFGGGSITAAHSRFGQNALTVNGTSSSAPGISLGAASETEQSFAALKSELAATSAGTQSVSTAPPAPGAAFDKDLAMKTWATIEQDRPAAPTAGKLISRLVTAAKPVGSVISGGLVVGGAAASVVETVNAADKGENVKTVGLATLAAGQLTGASVWLGGVLAGDVAIARLGAMIAGVSGLPALVVAALWPSSVSDATISGRFKQSFEPEDEPYLNSTRLKACLPIQ